MIQANVPDRLDPTDKDSIFFMEYMEDQQRELNKICNKISIFKTILKYIFE